MHDKTKELNKLINYLSLNANQFRTLLPQIFYSKEKPYFNPAMIQDIGERAFLGIRAILAEIDWIVR